MKSDLIGCIAFWQYTHTLHSTLSLSQASAAESPGPRVHGCAQADRESGQGTDRSTDSEYRVCDCLMAVLDLVSGSAPYEPVDLEHNYTFP